MGASVVGLLGSDLMVSSRLQGIIAKHGLRLRQIAESGDLSDLRLVLVDLNRQQEIQLERLRKISSSQQSPKVLAFGPHTLMRDLGKRARQAGADRVVANSALPAVLERMLDGGDAPTGAKKEQR